MLTEEERARRDAVVMENAALAGYEGPNIVPDSPNLAIPRDVWRKMQALGPVAVDRLQQMLESETFHKMRPMDRLAIIQAALNQAYPKETVTRHLHLHAPQNLGGRSGGDLGDVIDGNALSAMSRRARTSLPEFSRRSLANMNTGNKSILSDE
jgi:hypothetical protein